MKSKIKRIILLALCVALAGCFAVFAGCGSGKPEKETVTVDFIQSGETKAQITVERGKKIDEESVPAPSAERENCVTEWNFDFDLPVSKNTTADTVTYTRGLSFSKSLKGDYYLATITAKRRIYICPTIIRECPSVRFKPKRSGAIRLSLRSDFRLRSFRLRTARSKVATI